MAFSNFTFLYRLAHRAYPEQVLHKNDFEKTDRGNAAAFLFTIYAFYFLVDKTEIYRSQYVIFFIKVQ